MLPLAFALSLLLAGLPAVADPPVVEPAAAEDPFPAGAPREDYPFVAWCYGALRGYLDLHDQVMPEVTRIEGAFRKPGTKLSDDLKVYADMQKEGGAQLALYRDAMTAAEKASVRPLNALGAAAVRKGRSTWNAGPEVTKARMAQEWMSWVPPGRCERTARTLESRARLLGSAFKVNADPRAAPPSN
ncbi:MAG TPA: hypothetical protein VHN73_08770 [Phenylobacterium sp.]|nr:hypothetical protein [Phenylobacterium sp.]